MAALLCNEPLGIALSVKSAKKSVEALEAMRSLEAMPLKLCAVCGQGSGKSCPRTTGALRIESVWGQDPTRKCSD